MSMRLRTTHNNLLDKSLTRSQGVVGVPPSDHASLRNSYNKLVKDHNSLKNMNDKLETKLSDCYLKLNGSI